MSSTFSSTSFTSNPIISRPPPSAVIYDLSSPTHTTITLPVGSLWSSELHWHERHTEFLRVIKGSVRVRLDNRSFVVKAPKESNEEAIVRVDIGVRHEWKRADADEAAGEKDEEEVIVIESTEPADTEKRLFFWNLNGVILEAQQGSTREQPKFLAALMMEWRIMLHLFVIFKGLDNFPVFWDLSTKLSGVGSGLRSAKRAEGLITHGIFWLVRIAGAALGMRAVEERFTPKELYLEWKSSKKDL
ncbi:hypothetical protein NA57DRAFT_72698 [Rhizodiscina lignyota]|uniref:Uncharacterized protein n=1 Tax=Rhizodiscina lignyota TaxID=1504668 RepID=A0A9P4IGE2_9PEZI|nr:hypothetical protein NA57DRAFT_72698 [Rhizodiscina lignyota]